MLVRVNNIKMPIDATRAEVFETAARLLHVKKSEITSQKIIRRSIDARRGTVQFVYSVLTETKKDVLCDDKNIVPIAPKTEEPVRMGEEKLNARPVIAGFGPCGMFCALTLSRAGYRPIVIERGADIKTRTKKVDTFWKNGVLDETTNVQFGEGGAGTFSDGKLTTRIGDSLTDTVLKELVSHGAPEDILYHAMPHIGTDILKDVVQNIRKEILSFGGEIRFETKVTDITIKDGTVKTITLSDGDILENAPLILAIGHSARDTYEMLYRRGIEMIQKPFSVGFRAEHLKEDIDCAMYGKYAGHPLLGAATYQLSYREGERGCYSFCMCPGGTVVCASSENETIVTNGMSERARDKINSNSAICANVTGRDFGSNHPLAGVSFQRELEKKAFRVAGGAYRAPVQLLGDYMDGNVSKQFGRVTPSILPGTAFCDLNSLFSNDFNAFMKKGISSFERKIKGFTARDTVLTGVETRTSAPLRIVRNALGESVTARGLYPSGEGAGYAGGIMSAAVDGIRTAHRIIARFQPSDR